MYKARDLCYRISPSTMLICRYGCIYYVRIGNANLSLMSLDMLVSLHCLLVVCVNCVAILFVRDILRCLLRPDNGSLSAELLNKIVHSDSTRI